MGALALALGASTLLPLAGPTAAKEVVIGASSSYLCSGYDGCARAGYGHAGYQARGGSMYWNMYSGHNCTNYAAYRVIQAGGPATRPWSGSGNAMYWGTSNASSTDRTPKVGAVAWFRANRPGVSGSAGHVAYVERVVSPTEIIVSEDSWGGDFHWRRYSVAAGTWPDGFIHFADATPQLKVEAAPTVSGEPLVGSRLVSTRGAYEPRIESAGRQWLVDGSPVPGATARTFVLRPSDVGATVAVTVTGRRSGYEPTTSSSPSTAVVRRGLFSTARPTVTGEPVVGQTLTATPGAIAPEPGQRRLQWYADGRPLAGQTGERLRVEESLLGSTIAVQVTATSPGYRTVRRQSIATAPVSAPAVEVVEPAAVVGAARAGETLVVEPGSYLPSQAEVRYRWMRDGAPVKRGRAEAYEIRPRDVGGWMSVQVSVARPGFLTAEQLVEVPQPVRAVPEMTVEAVGASRRAVVELRLTAPGIVDPSGAVEVRVGARRVAGTLEAGTALFTLEGLRAGDKTVRARFLGAELMEPASVTTTVRVLR